METPTCTVTILAMAGAWSHRQMDEKSPRVLAYPNGRVMPGYAVKMSGEGIMHVRVSDMSKQPEWIRCWERDESNQLVSIDYIETPTSVLSTLSMNIGELTLAIKSYLLYLQTHNK